MGLNLHSMHIKHFHVTKIKQNLVFPTCAAHLTSKKWQEIHAVFTWENVFWMYPFRVLTMNTTKKKLI